MSSSVSVPQTHGIVGEATDGAAVDLVLGRGEHHQRLVVEPRQQRAVAGDARAAARLSEAR